MVAKVIVVVTKKRGKTQTGEKDVFQRDALHPSGSCVFSFRLPSVDACPFQMRDRCWGVWVCVQFGTVEARAYISGWASWRVELCGVGAGLHRNPVPGFLGVRHSPAGASL